MTSVFVGASPMKQSFHSSDLFLKRSVVSSLACVSCQNLSETRDTIVASEDFPTVVGLGGLSIFPFKIVNTDVQWNLVLLVSDVIKQNR